MSHYLDQAACSDAQRREDLARNDAAMAEPFVFCEANRICRPAMQGRDCICAQTAREADWIAADLARDAGKGERLAALSVECARQLELNGYIGELPR